VHEDDPVYHTITNRAPSTISRYRLGTQYAGYRAAGAIALLALRELPVSVLEQAPNGEFGSHVHARAWVPLDDGHTMFCFLRWKRGVSALTQPQPAFKDGTPIGGTGRATSSCRTRQTARPLAARREPEQRLGDRPRCPAQQRDLQRDRRHPPAGSGHHREHGPITDHAFEHLAPSDQMITRTRGAC